jgi:hypothetical protein
MCVYVCVCICVQLQSHKNSKKKDTKENNKNYNKIKQHTHLSTTSLFRFNTIIDQIYTLLAQPATQLWRLRDSREVATRSPLRAVMRILLLACIVALHRIIATARMQLVACQVIERELPGTERGR